MIVNLCFKLRVCTASSYVKENWARVLGDHALDLRKVLQVQAWVCGLVIANRRYSLPVLTARDVGYCPE